ncbi:MAG: SAM-dependent chlorinase/fluorinase [Deltaproteobacteria bacterium]|nr:SAM-dependent chlorinase/fluorinase [Deltaproteobacteria bacterium]
MARRIITLLTDFGLKDSYVAQVKAVILKIVPDVQFVDISHLVEPQNIVEAAFMLGCSFRWFQKGTVHLVVVDPGVGGQRRPIAVEAGGYRFVGPDNGVLIPAARAAGNEIEAREITNRDLVMKSVSSTFHGRDVFAPVAARLALGEPMDRVGPRVDDVVELNIERPVVDGGEIVARVVHVDRFGNLQTNLHETDPVLTGIEKDNLTVSIMGLRLGNVVRSYSDVEEGGLLALFGSCGYLEIAKRDGSAASEIGVGIGARVVAAGATRANDL